MIVLSVDTAHAACSVCVFDTAANRSLALVSEPMRRGHAERLAGMTQDAVAEAGLAFSDIDRLAACSGPGTFTGVRIGLAFVRGLALVLKAPAIGITSLEALAQGSRQAAAGRDIWVIQDARRGEVYLQGFDGDGKPLQPASVLAISSARDLLTGKSGLATGSGAHLVDLPDDMVIGEAGGIPDVAVIARLAGQAPDTGASAVPFYLRAADAKAQQPLVRHRRSDLSIEPAGAEYAGVLAAIHQPCFEDAWDAAAMAAVLATPGSAALLAVREEAGEKQPCGFVLLRTAADELEVLTLAVLPQARRRGVGRALMHAVRQHAEQAGVRKIFIEYARDNHGAHALYEGAGYVRNGVRSGYYRNADGTFSDAVTASLELAGAEHFDCHKANERL